MIWLWPDTARMVRSLLLIVGLLAAVPVAATELTLTYLAASSVALENPHDLKLSADGRYLYVADVGNNRIAILDPQTLALRGEFGADHQSGTHDIDFDNRGRAYVADTHNNRVLIYEVDGLKAERVGQLDARIRGPEGVLVHSNGRVYVAGAWSGNVVAYENGQVVAELDGLSSPHDLEIRRDGDIWLADTGNNRLLLLSPDLEIKRELGGSDYAFNGVRYLDLTPQGTIVAADKNNHVIKFIAAEGKLLLVLGDGARDGLAGRGPNRFTTPEGVELSGSSLWLSDSGNDRIVKYRINE